MNNKILFMIVDNQVKYLSGSTMDHREWYVSLGYDVNNFENIVRGIVADGKIVYYKGSAFNYDAEVLDAAKVYTPSIRTSLNINYPVFCGILINSYNSKWEPIVQINENEITGFVVTQKKEEKKVEPKVPVETRPVLEFKNNYDDPSFIKKAVIVTGVVLILEIIIKVILFNKQEILKSSSFFDVLLSFSQIGLLGFCIFGYLKKIPYTKYLSIVASVLILFTFDIFDIIIGILYALFSIDQGYFISLINMIKKLKRSK